MMQLATLILLACATPVVQGVIRFMTYNASLNRNAAGQFVAEISTPGAAQPAVIAEIIQRLRPDVLLINEFDYDPTAVGLFQRNYMSIGQNGAQPIVYPYSYIAPSNTGIPSGFDLDNSGTIGGGNDAFGFGNFPGQFGMVVYSMYPIDYSNVRTFQNFLWKDMPNNLIPTPFYSPEEVNILRLSSKSHWDVPIVIGADIFHFLVSHPTPPVFDGPEDRNGRRNYDEIRFWADYISSPATSAYIYDDTGVRGGLAPGEKFVIAGDQNSDPVDGDSIKGSAQLLLNHPLINNGTIPTSLGAVEQSLLQGQANVNQTGDPKFDTADFSDNAPGNLRVDYVLPRVGTTITNSGVFWPLSSDPLFRLIGVFPFPSSDHKPVYIDIPDPACGVTYKVVFFDDLLNRDVFSAPPCSLNIEALPSCPKSQFSGSVRLQLRRPDGSLVRNQLESVAPYYLFGDVSGKVLIGSVTPGAYTLQSLLNGVPTPAINFTIPACL
jgi:Endonuclease/Exonuclease/phosphatase family